MTLLKALIKIGTGVKRGKMTILNSVFYLFDSVNIIDFFAQSYNIVNMQRNNKTTITIYYLGFIKKVQR